MSLFWTLLRLKSLFQRTRAKACRQLAQLKISPEKIRKKVIPKLADILVYEGRNEVIRAAEDTLKHFKQAGYEQEVLEELLNNLNPYSPALNEERLERIEHVAEIPIQDLLVRFVEHGSSPKLRSKVGLVAAWRSQNFAILKPILTELADWNPYWDAFQHLLWNALNDDDTREPVIDFLIEVVQKESSYRLRSLGYYLLGQSRARRVIPVLLDRLKTERDDATMYALVKAFEALGDPRVIRPLIDFGKREYLMVSHVNKVAHNLSRKIHPHRKTLLCRNCLTRYTEDFSALGGLPVLLCRNCGDSMALLIGVETVVAVLDVDATLEIPPDDVPAVLRINYVKEDRLFDFDCIQIINAPDMVVERFCIRAGNDEDRFRRKRYKKIPCEVRCHLLPGTINMLERMFGEVTT